MVEVKFIGGVTEATLATVSFPDFKFDCSWNDSPVLGINAHWLGEVVLSRYCNEFKLQHLPLFVAFLPGINQVENTIV